MNKLFIVLLFSFLFFNKKHAMEEFAIVRDNYAKCFFMRSFSLDPADSLVFKGDIASHKTVTDSYVAIGSSPPSVYRNTASLTQELGCS